MGHKSMKLFELTIFDDKSLHHVYRIKEWVTSRKLLSIQEVEPLNCQFLRHQDAPSRGNSHLCARFAAKYDLEVARHVNQLVDGVNTGRDCN